MKNTPKLAVLCLLTVSVVARAQDAPKLIGEKTILKLDDTIAYGQNGGVWCMRLTPDGGRVLYLRKKMYKATMPDGAERQRPGYKLILRDLKTGKRRPCPSPRCSTTTSPCRGSR